jgi:hypothetical protein
MPPWSLSSEIYSALMERHSADAMKHFSSLLYSLNQANNIVVEFKLFIRSKALIMTGTR